MQKFIRGTLVLYLIFSLTSMAPMNIGFLLVLFSFLYLFFTGKRYHLQSFEGFQRYRFWALALLFTCWGSLVVTKFFPFAYADHAPEVTFHGFLKIWYLLIPAVLVFVYESGAEECDQFSLATLIKPWWITTLLLAVVAIVQYYTGWPFPQLIPDTTNRYHASLFFGHHLSTASVLIFPAFTALTIGLGILTRKKLAPVSLKFALLTGLGGVLILFLSYARTAWIALVVGFLFLLKKYLTPHLSRKQWVVGLSIITAAGSLLTQLPIVNDRLHKLYGISERTELWKANIDFFTHRPLTGIGWLKTQEMSEFYFKQIDPDHYREHFWGHAHSNIFEMLGGTGLFGLLAFLGWTFFTIRFAYRTAKKLESREDFFHADLAFGLFISLILLHVNGLTNVTFWEGKVMHQQMLAIGLLLILERRTHSSR